MKTLLSSILLGAALVLAAPGASAQLVGASSYLGHRGGYVSSRVWVPGHYESVTERVWVPGPCKRVWVEPHYDWRFGPCGARYVCVRAGYWRTVELPGHYENRLVRVWRPGQWVARGSCR